MLALLNLKPFSFRFQGARLPTILDALSCGRDTIDLRKRNAGFRRPCPSCSSIRWANLQYSDKADVMDLSPYRNDRSPILDTHPAAGRGDTSHPIEVVLFLIASMSCTQTENADCVNRITTRPSTPLVLQGTCRSDPQGRPRILMKWIAGFVRRPFDLARRMEQRRQALPVSLSLLLSSLRHRQELSLFATPVVNGMKRARRQQSNVKPFSIPASTAGLNSRPARLLNENCSVCYRRRNLRVLTSTATASATSVASQDWKRSDLFVLWCLVVQTFL